jgi:hypothetical protein
VRRRRADRDHDPARAAAQKPPRRPIVDQDPAQAGRVREDGVFTSALPGEPSARFQFTVQP